MNIRDYRKNLDKLTMYKNGELIKEAKILYKYGKISKQELDDCINDYIQIQTSFAKIKKHYAKQGVDVEQIDVKILIENLEHFFIVLGYDVELHKCPNGAIHLWVDKDADSKYTISIENWQCTPIMPKDKDINSLEIGQCYVNVVLPTEHKLMPYSVLCFNGNRPNVIMSKGIENIIWQSLFKTVDTKTQKIKEKVLTPKKDKEEEMCR
ncbi:MAG: hypothetical protein J6C13_01905 [Clostridia bacterium]|nr:hypothetical protein [Clostridia bacterium]